MPLPSARGSAAGGGAFVRLAVGGANYSLATTASGEVWAYLTLSPNSNPNSNPNPNSKPHPP